MNYGECTDCFVLKGRVLYSKGLYEEAFQDFHKVIHDLDPTLDTVAAYYYIASIHYRRGKKNTVRAVFFNFLRRVVADDFVFGVGAYIKDIGGV
jgi:tetratricopeptide (TPR) repeat protein